MYRTIKSYVLRTGRVSHRQQLALDNCLSLYELPIDGSAWDFSAIFGRDAKTIVEVGFGMGASLFAMAKEQPDINFIGIEVHRAGIGSLIADVHEHHLSNVRVATEDAVVVFKEQLNNESLAGIQIFFPDPWHKKKHQKRRLIQASFVEMMAKRLQPGGFIHCATDWQDYADHMLSVLNNEPALTNNQPEGGFSPRPASRFLTKFEARGQRLGHGVWDLIYTKRRDSDVSLSPNMK